MTPPETQGQGSNAIPPGASPAVSLCISTLQNRPDFLRAASSLRQATGGFLLQARDRHDATADVRVGFTASKKIGNAVARNRAKRRLREIARTVLPQMARPGWDYVLVAKPDATISRDYKDMLADFSHALRSVHRAAA